MEQGIILKGVGGIYDVQTERGIVECTLRGRLRLTDERVLVGDRVEITCEGEHAVVENILPRSNELTRPPIANLDQVVVVFAIKNPQPNFLLLDRILVHAELENLNCAVVFNKADLDYPGAKKLASIYEKISYPTVVTSVKEQKGIEEFSGLLQDKISTLAGPSGVGKSSLLNALDPDLKLETGKLSTRVQRGRHTTRSVQLLPLPTSGYVADTPGFSQLRLGSDLEAELQYAFPEIRELIGACRFRGCMHLHEPGCAVKEAVEAGEILRQRYEHYLILLEEVAPSY